MARYNSYIICTSPRSGSILLCKLLAATGIAGNPASLFYRPTLPDWLTRLGLILVETVAERELLETIFEAANRKERGDTAIFGLRQQRHGFDFLCEKLAILHPGNLSDCERIQRIFGTTLFIHLTRTDKLAQAVSYLKAEQTGLWHLAPDGTELERTAPNRAPVYDRDAIRAHVETMTAYDRAWETWFEREAIAPLRLSYDDLSDDPRATLRTILLHLGLDPAAADRVAPGVRKLADETSREWGARFRAENTLA